MTDDTLFVSLCSAPLTPMRRKVVRMTVSQQKSNKKLPNKHGVCFRPSDIIYVVTHQLLTCD